MQVLPVVVLAVLYCYHESSAAALQNSHHLVRRDFEYLKQLGLKEDNHRVIKRHAEDEEPLSRQKRTKREAAGPGKDPLEEALGSLIAETPLDRSKRFKRDAQHGGDVIKGDVSTKIEEVKEKRSDEQVKVGPLTKRDKTKKQHNRIKKNKKKRKNAKKHTKKHALLSKKHSHHDKHDKHKHGKMYNNQKRSKNKAHKKHQKRDKTKKLKKKSLKHKHKNELSKKNAPK